jgi:hypothetical protein
MTVSELIEILKQQPPDRLIVVNGYEGGYSDIEATSTIELAEYRVPYEGRYQSHLYYDEREKIYAFGLWRSTDW